MDEERSGGVICVIYVQRTELVSNTFAYQDCLVSICGLPDWSKHLSEMFLILSAETSSMEDGEEGDFCSASF